MRFRACRSRWPWTAAPVAAQAQPFQGVYIGAGAGYN